MDGRLLNAASCHYMKHDMLHLAMDAATLKNGLVLEFGVYHGFTIRMAGAYFHTEPVHGFDTFSGLPEAWNTIDVTETAGSYSTHGHLPPAPENVQYHVGLIMRSTSDLWWPLLATGGLSSPLMASPRHSWPLLTPDDTGGPLLRDIAALSGGAP